jgi:hypothetical protein
MATSSDCCMFLESANTGKKGHNVDCIAGEISRVFIAFDSTFFAKAVTVEQ